MSGVTGTGQGGPTLRFIAVRGFFFSRLISEGCAEMGQGGPAMRDVVWMGLSLFIGSEGGSYRMERPVIRAGFAPAEDPRLSTAHAEICSKCPPNRSDSIPSLISSLLSEPRFEEKVGWHFLCA